MVCLDWLGGKPFVADLGATVSDLTSRFFCSGSYRTLYYSFGITDALGTYHPTNTPEVVSDGTGNCGATQATGTTTDGTGYTLNITATNPLTYAVYDRTGNKVTSSTANGLKTTTVTDPDNIQFTAVQNTSTGVTTYNDTLGTVALTSTPGGSPGNPDKYAFANSNGIPVKVNYTQEYLKTNFACTNGILDWDLTNLTLYFPTSVVLPDGETFGIFYETTPGYPSDITGRIAKITLPSGGSISYKYEGGNNGIDCNSAVVPKLTRTVNDNNGNNGPWTYVNSNDSTTPGNYTVTETDPAQNQTVHYFSGEYQTAVWAYQGQSTGGYSGALRVTTTCYNGNFTNCESPSAVPSLPIKQTDVYTWVGVVPQALTETIYDCAAISPCYGNVTEIKRYDWGASSPPSGSPLSDEIIRYGSYNGGPCNALPNYIQNGVCADQVTGRALTSLTTYSYTGNHPTTINQWVSGQSNYLISHLVWNSNGTLKSRQDPAGNTTSFSYNGTGGCSALLVTGTTYAMSSVGSGSQTWDCNGGVVKSATDPNRQVTQYTYDDPLWRLTQVSNPDGGVTTTSYNTGSSLPWTISTCSTISSSSSCPSGSNSLTNLTKLDGLGRVVEKQLTSDPSGVDYTDTTYNNLGQVTSVTQPYRSGASVYSTQYFYDALGRTTQQVTPNNGNKYLSYAGRATQIQQFPSYSNQTTIYQANGLGQIVSACEVTSQTQAGSIQHSNCGLDIAGSGFLTSYSYNALGNLTGVSNATNTRAFAYDGLLRLTQAVEPELYMNAVNYSYDTQSPGDLYQRTAPAPNQSGSATVATTYTHDAMHRLTQVNYSDGTTPSVTLAYDQASNWGEPLPYPKGRLTGRFTCSPGTSCGTTSAVSAGLTGDVFAFIAVLIRGVTPGRSGECRRR